MVAERWRVEAAAVTAERVRCSALLGDVGGVGNMALEKFCPRSLATAQGRAIPEAHAVADVATGQIIALTNIAVSKPAEVEPCA
jgi:hypothetical protein